MASGRGVLGDVGDPLRDERADRDESVSSGEDGGLPAELSLCVDTEMG
jgi:hypothetical protein